MADMLEELRDDLSGEYSLPLPDNSTSLALEASRIVKSGAGRLWGITGTSNLASAQFIQVFDSATLPADGAIPVIVISVPALNDFSWDGGQKGRAFRRGIVVCNSTTLATKTIGAANCWFDVQYV